ncbi:MAG: UDP-N-acetylmuramoyl-L-alanyl-D-glutamate--2,6-diaminopimelate ligase, partial [Elusimicrobia bacterium]|nr:UDP-N-acetylmuramoyl-L-alanyl-D-glutamate--2,6-diaminopimelate ligase [Elusimicrobiota bacterium]
SILGLCGISCGVIGTINYRLDSKELAKASHTTPLSLDLEKLLAQMRAAGVTHVVMEVSSHALALKRVEEILFDAGIFTNLHRDHLDFHHTPENYFMAKAHLFELLRNKMQFSSRKETHAVLNADDPHTSRLLEMIHPGIRTTQYGLSTRAQWRGENILESLEGISFDLCVGDYRSRVQLKLIGRHNVYNALAAAAAAEALEFPRQKISEGLEALSVVPGRLEPVRCGQDFHVLVDFAHTDSALEEVLLELERLKKRGHLAKVITVFGCGGDRDRTKRGPMGLIACQYSDWVIVTSDNPRSESPGMIIEEIQEAIEKKGFSNYQSLPDRAEAIQCAIKKADRGDVVLIAGKGHEDYQILNDRTVHFDDREVAREAIRKCG